MNSSSTGASTSSSNNASRRELHTVGLYNGVSSSSNANNMAQRGTLSSPPSSGSLIRQTSTADEAQAVRMNILNSSVQEARDVSNNRMIMLVATALVVPQIIATCIVAGMNWGDASDCNRVRLWVVLYTLHIAASLVVEWSLFKMEGEAARNGFRSSCLSTINNMKYILELLGLFLFLVGNMWVISQEGTCGENGKPMYYLAVSFVIISYVKIFLPCIIILAMLPIICFCLPCVIRLLHRLQDPMAGKGASKEAINCLEEKLYSPSMALSEDSTCCICLNEYENGQKMRLLPCQHHFHKDCVDEWLHVNATCPTCRHPINGENEDESTNRNESERLDSATVV